MANISKEELKKQATELGIQLNGQENSAELKDLIANHKDTDVDSGNIASSPAESDPTVDDDAENVESEDEDLEKSSAELSEKLTARKQEIATAKGVQLPENVAPNGERLYTRAELEKVVSEIIKKNKTDEKTEEDIDELTHSEVRLARYNNKFIVGFKEQSVDDFFASEKCFSIDIWDERNKQNVPTVTVLFEDETEMTVPLRRIVEVAGKYTVPCKVIEVLEEDKSYSIGKVEQVVYKDETYRPEATGIKVNQKVVQKRYSYRVEIPATAGGSAREIVVQPEVINW